MFSRRSVGLGRRTFTIAVISVCVLPLLVSSAGGQESPPCPEPIPVAELEEGQRGYGLTVANDRQRETFAFEIIGVLEDALGPGRDLIIVDTSGAVIDRHGGIFYGMSGSPLFIGDRLVGAIAYGLSSGSSSVAGVTPATDIVDVLRYPVASQDSEEATPTRSRRMSERTRSTIADSASMEASEVGASFVRLRVPVGISGVSGPGLESIAGVFAEERLRLIPHSGGAADEAQTLGAAPQPGDNLSAVLSYGDVTFAATGTVTLACEDRFVAFGHPFFWEGQTTFGGHAAETITVIEDDLFGSYEMASIAEPVGLVDQDRLAGIRGLMGVEPGKIPITSVVTASHLDRTREGTTSVVESEYVPFLAFYHLYSNLLVTMDEYGGGTSAATFTINGIDEDGAPWQLERSNMYASEDSIASASSFEVESFLHTLYNNPFEGIEFTGVDAVVTADDEVTQYTIGDVLVSTTGSGYRDRRRVRVTPGSTIFLRVKLVPTGEETEIPVDLEVRVPRRGATDGTIEISGPRFYEDEICFYEPSECMTSSKGEIDSLEELIADLEARPKNNELRAQLRMGRRGRVVGRDSEILDRVIGGAARLRVMLSCCSGESGMTAEPKRRPPG